MIDIEMREAGQRYGSFNSPHELFGVLKEEMDEYWDSIKADEENLYELLQVIAVASRYLLERLEYEPNTVASIEKEQRDRWMLNE